MPVPKSTTAGVKRRLRKDEVYDRLLLAILDGTLEPGERIRDNDLQEWFGVSRTPIRLAIDRLEEIRLVESRPNRYTRVSPATPRRIPQMLDVMCALWSLAVRRTVETMTTSQVAECVGRLERASESCRTHAGCDAGQVVEEVRQALFYFSEHSGNVLLQNLVTKLGVALRFQLSLRGAELDIRLVECVLAELREAVQAGDVEAAGAAIRHLRAGEVFRLDSGEVRA